jgi:hypothetical protein
MQMFSNQQVEKIIVDESLIKSIAWVNEFKDIVIDISWCGQEDFKGIVDFEKIKTSLYFDFVTEFEASIKFKEGTMGAIEITSFKFEFEKDSWAIEFKFKFFPVGSLKFNCNDFRFVIDPV